MIYIKRTSDRIDIKHYPFFYFCFSIGLSLSYFGIFFFMYSVDSELFIHVLPFLFAQWTGWLVTVVLGVLPFGLALKLIKYFKQIMIFDTLEKNLILPDGQIVPFDDVHKIDFEQYKNGTWSLIYRPFPSQPEDELILRSKRNLDIEWFQWGVFGLRKMICELTDLSEKYNFSLHPHFEDYFE